MKVVACLFALLHLWGTLTQGAAGTSVTVYLSATNINDDIRQVELTDGTRYLVSLSRPSIGSTVCYCGEVANQGTEDDVNENDVTPSHFAELMADPATVSMSVGTAGLDTLFSLCDGRPEEVNQILSDVVRSALTAALTTLTAGPRGEGEGEGVRKRSPKRGLDLFIYPGTKWCGAGNIAANATDIGTLVETDTCCRAHDQCDVIIDSWDYKYGMWNWSLWRVSHCDCDDAFKRCLKAVKNVSSGEERSAARTILNVFFRLLDIDCFVFNADGDAVMRS